MAKLNTDENPSTPGRYNVHAIPTMIMFKDGIEVMRHVGFSAESNIASKVQEKTLGG